MRYLVFCLGQSWDRCFSKHLTKAIARRNSSVNILCLDRPFGIFDVLFKGLNAYYHWYNNERRPRRLDKNRILFRPYVIVHDHIARKIPFINKLNIYLIKKQIIKYFNFEPNETALWIFDPFQEEYIGMLGEKVAIYEAFDDYSEQGEMPYLRTRKELVKAEISILKKVDVVFTVSDILTNKIGKHKKSNVYTIPNGVDEDLIRCNKPEIPADLINIKRPMIGYWGRLTNRVDLRYLESILSINSWQVVVIGGIEGKLSKEFEKLLGNKNMHVLGVKSYSVLPDYVSSFDVAIIPYKVNDFNKACSPLKLYEYLAAGVPVVSTQIPDVARFGNGVYVAGDPKEFVGKIEEALMNDEKNRERLIDLARNNSWGQRATSMLEILDRVFDDKSISHNR